MYKCHKFLDETQVECEISRCFDIISKRVKVMLLLQHVDERREIPAILQLNASRQSKDERPSLSSATSMATISRMELAKNKIKKDQTPSDLASSIKGSLQTTNSAPSSQAPAKQATTSRFKQRMDKYNKPALMQSEVSDTAPSLAPTASDGTSLSEPTLRESSQKAERQDSLLPNVSLATSHRESEVLKVNKVFQHCFPLYHSVIRVEDGLKAIEETTFLHFRIENQNNLFVMKRDGLINLIKLTGQSHHPGHYETINSKQNLMRSFNQSQQLFVGPH